MPKVNALDVRLYGIPIATLSHVSDKTIFAFDDAYIEDAGRPTLGLWFKDAFGHLRTDFRGTSQVLPPFFSNLLPEGPLRTYLAARCELSGGCPFGADRGDWSYHTSVIEDHSE